MRIPRQARKLVKAMRRCGFSERQIQEQIKEIYGDTNAAT